MKFLRFLGLLFFCSVLFLTDAWAILGFEEKEIAYSDLLKTRVFAVLNKDGRWCDNTIHLTVYAPNSVFFTHINQLMEKLAKVIDKECPIASTLRLNGFVGEKNENSTPVYSAQSYAVDGWLIKENSPLLNNFVEIFTSFSKKPFPVSGWTPAKGYATFQKEEDKDELDEFVLQDRLGLCKIKYLSPKTSLDGWYISVQNAACTGDFLQGSAIVSVYTQNDILYQTMKGFFNNGSLVNSYELTLPFSFRKGRHEERQKAYTLVHSNADLRIYTFIESDAVLNGEYMPFESCKPFQLYFLTENEYFFTQEDILPNLISVGKSYAQTLCPTVEEVILNATYDPLLKEENIFYRLHLKRDGFSPWQTQKATSFNKAGSQINEQQDAENKKAIRMRQDYERLKTASFNEKLAFLYNRDTLDALPNFLKAAEISGQEVTGVFLIQLPENDSPSKWILWPKEALRLKNIPDIGGWILAEGTITSLPRFEKRRFGIAFHQPAGEIKILSYKSCVRPYCEEFNDPLYLLKYYYNLSEWAPAK